ncbi:ABC transporter ATP-binding protein [Actinacidiphila reveromycinica]|nr:ABC transporter ATP-binding protein [Streptomyces sp. SN-593]
MKTSTGGRTAPAPSPAPAETAPPRRTGHLEVAGLTRDFGSGGVRDASFSVERGQLVTLLGPSGCGKTTTLRCLAGIEVPDAGRVRLGDTTMTATAEGVHLRPAKRDIGMVFQSYALWPHMSVFENVAFPLRTRGERTAAIRPRVEEMLELVGLEGMGRRQPSQLSGGQQQRVALARALVYRPGLLLLDEPLSNLDAARRDAVRRDIGRLQRELAITAVYVTHDQDEAMTLSDRILVMRDGAIVQNGTPAELLAAPRSLFVAGLLGQINVLTGVLATERTRTGPNGTERVGGVDIALADGTTRLSARLVGPAAVGENVSVVWRPGDITIDTAADDPSAPDRVNALPGTVTAVRVGSSVTEYDIDAGITTLRALGLGRATASVGSRVHVSCPVDRSISLTH